MKKVYEKVADELNWNHAFNIYTAKDIEDMNRVHGSFSNHIARVSAELEKGKQ